MAEFCNGKLRETSLDFVFIFCILGSILGPVGAAKNYYSYPVLSLPNVVSIITHSISGFTSLYIANIILDYNYMFLMNHDGTPYITLYNFYSIYYY